MTVERKTMELTCKNAFTAHVADHILAARNGDHEAFAALVRRYTDPLHRYLTVMGFSKADAEDVIQETFLRGWRHLGTYDNRFAFSTWIYTIARRLALNHRQRQKSGRGLDAAAECTASESVPASGELWAKARSVLSERDFSALWLRYGEDRDLADIATILRITPVNARVTLHRARERLASALSPDYQP